jgi:GT2 family glycosyltransferase
VTRSTTDAERDASVEVLVVAYGAPGLLEESLATLDGKLPVTVLDNSSRSDVKEVCRRLEVRYVDTGSNLGFAGGVNMGIARRLHPGADLLLLNPDARITAEGIHALRVCLHASPRRACVAPRQTGMGGETARVSWPFPSPAGAWADALGLGQFRKGRQFLIGSVLLIKADALAEVGGFDERYFLYAEETDWQYRAQHLGWTSDLCTEVVATHVGAGTGGDPTVRDTHFHASTERYVRKHHGTVGWNLFRAGVMTGAAVRALLLPRNRGDGARARLALYRTGPCRAETQLPS